LAAYRGRWYNGPGLVFCTLGSVWDRRAEGASVMASAALVASWCVLLGAVLARPSLFPSADPGDDLTRDTVRVALLSYGAAAVLMLLLRPGDWDARTPRGEAARWCWTLAWAAFLVHLAMAFHHYHGWSHARAVEHTRAVSGVGEGIYVSHLFTLLWTLDVAWWWLRPMSYAARPGWVGRGLHGFMLFIVFNATVVYEAGPIRWAGLALTEVLVRLWALQAACRRAGPAPTTAPRPAQTTWIPAGG